MKIASLKELEGKVRSLEEKLKLAEKPMKDLDAEMEKLVADTLHLETSDPAYAPMIRRMIAKAFDEVAGTRTTLAASDEETFSTCTWSPRPAWPFSRVMASI